MSRVEEVNNKGRAATSLVRQVNIKPRIVGNVLPPLIVLGVCAGIWQVVALHNHDAIPTLRAIFAQLFENPGQYLTNGLITLEEMVVGLFSSLVIAFGLAVAMVEVRVVERAIMPLAVVLNVTPVVSFAPGLVVFFGLGMTPKYLVTAIIVFFPFLVNSLIGLRSVDPEALDFFRSLDARRSQVLTKLRIPSSLPFLFAAARICVPLSIVGAVVAEFTASGNDRGLGSAIEVAYQQGNLPSIYAPIVCLVIVGLLASGLIVFCERRFLSWHWSTASHTIR